MMIGSMPGVSDTGAPAAEVLIEEITSLNDDLLPGSSDDVAIAEEEEEEAEAEAEGQA